MRLYWQDLRLNVSYSVPQLRHRCINVCTSIKIKIHNILGRRSNDKCHNFFGLTIFNNDNENENENGTLDCKVVVKCLRTSVLISGRVASLNNDVHWCKNRRTLLSKWAGLLQVGKQTATSPNTAPWQVTHLLPPGSNLPAEDYILLHPDAAKYIWFPDIYIGGLTAAAEPKT